MASALLLMIVGGMLISSWVSLMSTRAVQVSYMEDICRRRIGLESSRLLARAFSADKAFRPGDTLASNQDVMLGTNIGGINSFDGWSNLNIYTSDDFPGDGLTTVFPYNYSGLRPSASFLSTERITRPAAGVAGNVDNFTDWHFLKTLPPVLGGDIFCIYRKPDIAVTELDVYTNTNLSNPSAGHHANWIVEGRTVVRHPPSLFVPSTPSPLKIPFQTRSLYIQSHADAEPPTLPFPIYGVDPDGKDMLPSNLAVTPSTTGPVSASEDKRYDGYLNVIKNDNNPDNSLWHFQDREQLAGRTETVTVDVGSTFNSPTEAYWVSEQSNPTHKPPGWPSGYGAKLKVLFIKLDSSFLKNMRIYGVIDQIVFVGQANVAAFESAAALKPVIITVMPDPTGRWVRDVRFERENSRRHVLAFQNDFGRTVEFSWVNNPVTGNDFRWRSVLISEYQNIMFNMPDNLVQNVRWIGGVMTNWSIKRRAKGGTNASRLTFAPDTDSSVPATPPGGPSFAHFLPRDAWQETYFTP